MPTARPFERVHTSLVSRRRSYPSGWQVNWIVVSRANTPIGLRTHGPTSMEVPVILSATGVCAITVSVWLGGQMSNSVPARKLMLKRAHGTPARHEVHNNAVRLRQLMLGRNTASRPRTPA